MRDPRGASDDRSCAYVDVDSPKYSVAQVMGFMKGKTAIHIARVYAGRRKSFVGQQFWARGYWVSTVGRDEAVVRRYIQEQEKEDQRLDQLTLMPL
jgi:putative transposase